MGAAIFTERRVRCFLDSTLSASVPRNFPRESLSERHFRREFHAGVEYSPGICLYERTLSLHSVREPVSKIISPNYRTGLVFMVSTLVLKETVYLPQHVILSEIAVL